MIVSIWSGTSCQLKFWKKNLGLNLLYLDNWRLTLLLFICCAVLIFCIEKIKEVYIRFAVRLFQNKLVLSSYLRPRDFEPWLHDVFHFIWKHLKMLNSIFRRSIKTLLFTRILTRRIFLKIVTRRIAPSLPAKSFIQSWGLIDCLAKIKDSLEYFFDS